MKEDLIALIVRFMVILIQICVSFRFRHRKMKDNFLDFLLKLKKKGYQHILNF